MDIFVTRLHLMDGSIWKKFYFLATNLSDLKLVVEMFYHMANSKIVHDMSTLLKTVKSFWQDEELIHGTVKLQAKLWAIVYGDSILDPPYPKAKIDLEMKALTTSSDYLSVLMRISFVKYPTFFDTSFSFPRKAPNVVNPLMREWLEALILGYKGGQNMLKAIRPIVPIISRTLEDVIEKDDLAATYGSDGYIVTILKVLNVLLRSMETSFDADFKLVVETNIMMNLMAVFEKYPTDVIFKAPERCIDGKDIDCDISIFCMTIESFMTLLSKITLPKDANEKLAIVETILTLVGSEKFYEKEIIKFHNKTACRNHVPFTLRDLFDTLQKIYEDDLNSWDFFEKYCNGVNIVSPMIAMVKNNPEAKEHVAPKLSKIVKNCKSPGLIDLILPYLSHGCDSVTVNTRYQFNTYLSKSQSFGKGYDKEGRQCTIWQTGSQHFTFDVLDFVVEHAPLSRLKEIDTEYKFIEFTLKIIEISNVSSFVERAFRFLLNLMDKHHFEMLSPKVLVDQMPKIWKRKNLDRSTQKCARQITVKVAFLLMSDSTDDSLRSKLENMPAFEATVVDFVKNHWGTVPRKPEAVGLIWYMAKSGRYRRLIKTFSLMESPALENTVGYLDFGNAEIARIFKHLSNMIIKYLVRNPPYNEKYLVDLTHCMVVIARSSSLDEESYVLEDLVSPAMWLLEKQNDPKIVSNVKEFISILH